MAMWRGMTVHGETFSPDEMAEAWEEWNPMRGYLGLGYALEKARGVPLEIDTRARAGDRMVQIARKAGLAEYRGGRWLKKDAVALNVTE